MQSYYESVLFAKVIILRSVGAWRSSGHFPSRCGSRALRTYTRARCQNTMRNRGGRVTTTQYEYKRQKAYFFVWKFQIIMLLRNEIDGPKFSRQKYSYYSHGSTSRIHECGMGLGAISLTTTLSSLKLDGNFSFFSHPYFDYTMEAKYFTLSSRDVQKRCCYLITRGWITGKQIIHRTGIDDQNR